MVIQGVLSYQHGSMILVTAHLKIYNNTICYTMCLSLGKLRKYITIL